jgi:hypothetical protein
MDGGRLDQMTKGAAQPRLWPASYPLKKTGRSHTTFVRIPSAKGRSCFLAIRQEKEPGLIASYFFNFNCKLQASSFK